MNDSSRRRTRNTRRRGRRINSQTEQIRKTEKPCQCQTLGVATTCLVGMLLLLLFSGSLKSRYEYYRDIPEKQTTTLLLDNNNNIGKDETVINDGIRILAAEDVAVPVLLPNTNHPAIISSSLPPLFASDSKWTNIDELPNVPSTMRSVHQKFVWAPAQEVVLSGTPQQRWTKASSSSSGGEESLVLVEGTTASNATLQSWFRAFGGLSNYEIVCWFGNRTAQMQLEAFKSLRGDLFPQQRPFKFHYHPVARLQYPDERWDADLKIKFRKCKQSLVVLGDDVEVEEPFQDHVVAFVKHLMAASPDSSFPIWIVTAAAASATTSTTTTTIISQDDGGQQRGNSNNNRHQELYDLVARRADYFLDTTPERLRLLDNTDLIAGGAPAAGLRPVDILGVIALRTYVILGKQVQEWRAVGQVGAVDGLHRGDVLEPNQELVEYQWN